MIFLGIAFPTSLAVRGSSRRTTHLNYNEDMPDNEMRSAMSNAPRSKPRKVIGPDGVERVTI